MTVKAKPRIEAYIGASGSGKGVSINRRLAELKPGRLLIWDPRGEYSKHALAGSPLVGHGSCIIPRSKGSADGTLRAGVASMYVLTIVFLVSRITIQSLHANADVCEQIAARARTFDAGPQAVLSAKCELQKL